MWIVNRAETPITTEKLLLQHAKLEQENVELKAKLRWYEEQFRLAQHRRFAASSEKMHPDQLLLFNEAEAEADPAKEEPTLESISYKRKKRKGQREPNLEGLRTERVEYRQSPPGRGAEVCLLRRCPERDEH